MRPIPATGLLVAGVVMVAGGCAAQPASPAGPSPAVAPTGTSTLAACPRPTGAAALWPVGVPAGVPLPPGSTIDTATTDNGTQRIRFHLPLSFRESVLLYLSGLRDNGFTVGTGDAEAEEADIPFSGKGAELSLKLRALPDPCLTEGVLVAGAAI
jgi:hypothetical protein